MPQIFHNNQKEAQNCVLRSSTKIKLSKREKIKIKKTLIFIFFPKKKMLGGLLYYLLIAVPAGLAVGLLYLVQSPFLQIMIMALAIPILMSWWTKNKNNDGGGASGEGEREEEGKKD